MPSNELVIKIQKANEKLLKKLNTIEKKEKWIASGKKDEYEIRWLQDDIKRLKSEIAETKKTIEKYEKQLSGQIERERVFLEEVPESMKQLQNELVDRWNEYDFRRRNELRTKYQEIGYSEFFKRYKRSNYEFMQLSDDSIVEKNKEIAKALIIDLYYRITCITGEVTEWAKIFCSGGALNGIVTGKEGKAKIETILAGGYNIQKLHIRVLVHSL